MSSISSAVVNIMQHATNSLLMQLHIGSVSKFWEQLGFDTDALTFKYDPENPDKPFMTYEQFLGATTQGFSGTTNMFNPQTTTSGTSEMSYISYVDSLNMVGWYAPNKTTTGTYDYTAASKNDYANMNITYPTLTSQFALQNKIIYFNVETTTAINATNLPNDPTDTGHALISIEGYNGNLITEKDKLSVKTLVSTYFSSPNSFITNAEPDSFVYEHIGEPIKLQHLKVRILDPYTGKELLSVGDNSSVYLEITQALTKNSTASALLDN